MQQRKTINAKRRTLFLVSLLAYPTMFLILSRLWYAHQPMTGFHFFDDWAEWRGMDKLGHFFTAFHISDIGVHLLGWAGVSRRKSIWYGSLAGIFFQMPIEIMDGFGVGYGFSWGDVGANLAGTAFLTGQYLLWNELRLIPKFSFSPTGFAALRPSLLGENIFQQFLKDYNGQTYWLGINIGSFFKEKSKNLSPFLPFLPSSFFLLSFGYGAEGMIFGREFQNVAYGLQPFSQYFLSLDVDLSRIPARKPWLLFILFGLNKLHCFFPALEIRFLSGMLWHFLYF
jgi:uncharacterized protein YfiM (DUF2279 family)